MFNPQVGMGHNPFYHQPQTGMVPSGIGVMGPGKPVGVFWDIENCPLPKGKSASSVIHFIRNTFVINRLSHREYEFLIAADITKLRKDIPDDANRSGGVTLAHVSGTSKNAADEKLRDCMKKFVDAHGVSSPLLVLISGDIDFVNDLRGYQNRQGCSIIVIHGACVSEHFRTGWNEIYPFQNFLAMMEPTAAKPSGSIAAKPEQASNSSVSKSKSGGQQKSEAQTQNDSSAPEAALSKKAQKRAEAQSRKQGNAPLNLGFQETSQGNGTGMASKQVTRPPTPRGPPQQGFQGSSNQRPRGPHNADQNRPQMPAPGQMQPNFRNQGPRPRGPQNADQNRPHMPAQMQPNFRNQGPRPRGQLTNNEQQSFPNQRARPQENIQNPPQHGNGKKNKNKNDSLNGPNFPNEVDPAVKKIIKDISQLSLGTTAGSNEVILMVSGLPGKMDFRILKSHLQEYAASVSGRVKYVHNGQGFITFNKKEDAERAVKLFQGRDVYGKKLNISLAKSIPFPAAPQPQQGRSASNGEEVVNSQPRSSEEIGGQQFVDQIGQIAAAAAKQYVAQYTEKMGETKAKQKDDPNCVIQ